MKCPIFRSNCVIHFKHLLCYYSCALNTIGSCCWRFFPIFVDWFEHNWPKIPLACFIRIVKIFTINSNTQMMNRIKSFLMLAGDSLMPPIWRCLFPNVTSSWRYCFWRCRSSATERQTVSILYTRWVFSGPTVYEVPLQHHPCPCTTIEHRLLISPCKLLATDSSFFNLILVCVWIEPIPSNEHEVTTLAVALCTTSYFCFSSHNLNAVVFRSLRYSFPRQHEKCHNIPQDHFIPTCRECHLIEFF